MDAKKKAIGRAEAIALARTAKEIYATKGKSVHRLDMKTNPADDEIAALIIGPSGNLRAPAIVKGDTLIVGFDEGTYANLLVPK